MLVGTVVGQIWSTQKDASLAGLRFLVVRPFRRGGDDGAETVVAVDTIGAGTGERVLVVFGRAARHAIGRGQDIGFQTAIVGIIDGMELEGGARVGQVQEQDQPAETRNQ
ncbi:MAG: EutN/CcmL family microcompartment protein [Planctomycetota bacterium]